MFVRMIIPAIHRQDWTVVDDNTPEAHASQEDAWLGRRASRRFPIELPVEMSVRKTRISGVTVNISSGGLLMACSAERLRIGTHVRVRITEWPISRNGAKLALVFKGTVIRRLDGYVAVRRNRYLFTEL